MTILLTGSGNDFLRLISTLVIFVGVLVLVTWVTKWMAQYQKGAMVNSNVEIVETSRLTNNKYIQIIRIGEKYMAIAVCKDTVTVLCELSEDELKLYSAPGNSTPDFKAVLGKFIKKEQARSQVSQHGEEPKEEANE